MKTIESFKIIGISTITTNENGKSAVDLRQLWERFFTENLSDKIKDKANSEIYSVYTDYESDFKGKYTTIIGFKVNSLENIPENLIGRELEGDTFTKYTAKGKMPDAIVEIWKEIWAKDYEKTRKYTYDFEVYGEKSQNGENSEVEIYIATKTK